MPRARRRAALRPTPRNRVRAARPGRRAHRRLLAEDEPGQQRRSLPRRRSLPQRLDEERRIGLAVACMARMRGATRVNGGLVRGRDELTACTSLCICHKPPKLYCAACRRVLSWTGLCDRTELLEAQLRCARREAWRGPEEREQLGGVQGMPRPGLRDPRRRVVRHDRAKCGRRSRFRGRSEALFLSRKNEGRAQLSTVVQSRSHRFRHSTHTSNSSCFPLSDGRVLAAAVAPLSQLFLLSHHSVDRCCRGRLRWDESPVLHRAAASIAPSTGSDGTRFRVGELFLLQLFRQSFSRFPGTASVRHCHSSSVICPDMMRRSRPC